MGLLDLINHLLNFVAPALWVGLLVAYMAPLLNRNMAVARVRYAQAAINSIAGVLALGAGLWFFGRDGKVASYAALVLACAASQWVCARR